MPHKSTVLDFAYEIHTELGSRCVGGKVSQKLVPLSHVLKSGDQVEIVTSKVQQPNSQWLNLWPWMMLLPVLVLNADSIIVPELFKFLDNFKFVLFLLAA